MAIIYSYPLQTTIDSTDLLTGTKKNATSPSQNPTVCWTVGTLDNFIQTSIGNVAAYDDDVAAGVGGLVAGQLYQTTGLGAAPLNAAGIVMIKQ